MSLANAASRRDQFGQQIGEWSDQDYDLLSILEEVSSSDINPDKTLAAYMVDIKELLRLGLNER